MRNSNEKRFAWFLLIGSAALFFTPLGWRALWDSDEGRYAEIAREMLTFKDWITPHLNYVVYLEKPPLMYWLTAVSMRVLGSNAFAARVPCALFGFLTVWITTRFGKRWRGERTGILAGGILATSVGFYVLTQFLVLDMALTFWMNLALFSGAALLVERSPDQSRKLVFLGAFAIAGGVLTKGIVAILLPIATLGAVHQYQRRRMPLRHYPWIGGVLLGLVLTVPWFVAVTMQNPVFPQFFFIHEHFQRFLTNIHHRSQPVYFFLPVIFAGFMPWTVFLPRVIQTWFSHHRSALRKDPEGAVLVFWSVLVFLFFSASHSKLVGYVIPIFPALSLLMAGEFETVLNDEGSVPRPLPLWIIGGLMTLLVLFSAAILVFKLPPSVLSLTSPEWMLFISQAAPLALVLGFGVFILVGVWGMRRPLWCVAGVAGVQVLLLITLSGIAGVLDPFQSTRGLAARLSTQAAPDEKVVSYGISYENSLQTLPFYAGRRIAVLGDPGELALGLGLDPEAPNWFAGEADATAALVAMPASTWAITDQEHWQTLQQAAPGDVFQLNAQQGNLLLIRKTR